MRYLYYGKIFFYSIKKNWKQVLISSVGIFIALFFYLSIYSVTEGMSKLIRSRLIGDMPINTIHVKKKFKGKKFSFSQVINTKNFDGIDLNKIKKIKQIKGIKNISYVQTLQRKVSFYYEFPDLGKSKIENSINEFTDLFTGENKSKSLKSSGQGIVFDGVVSGISYNLARPGLRIMKYFRQSKDGTIPLMVPLGFRDIAAVYMDIHGIPSSLLPDMNTKTFGKLKLDMFLDYSVGLQSGTKDKKYKMKVAGILPNNEVLAFALPLYIVRKWNKEINPKAARLYSDLFIEVKNSAYLDSVTKQIKKLGLVVKSSSKVARKADKTIKLVQKFFRLITFVFLLLAAIAIVNAFLLIVLKMQKEIALFRFLGASKIYIASLIIFEAFIIGMLHGLMAWYGAKYIIAFLNRNILSWLPFLPLQKGEILFSLAPELFIKVVLVSAFSAAAAAFIPALRASGQSILSTLRK